MATQVAEKGVSKESRIRLETLQAQIAKVAAELAEHRAELAAAESEIRAGVRSAALAGDGEVVQSDRSRRLAPLRDQVDDASDALSALEGALPEVEQAAARERCEEATAQLAEINGEAVAALGRFKGLWAEMVEALAEIDALAAEHNAIFQSAYLKPWRALNSEFADREPQERAHMALVGLKHTGVAFAVQKKALESAVRMSEFYGSEASKFRARAFEPEAFLEKWAVESTAEGGSGTSSGRE